jgi:Zn-dependent alcohol dehydrogenase
MANELMRAARFYELNAPLRIENIPIPEVGDDEVLVQVKAVGSITHTFPLDEVNYGLDVLEGKIGNPTRVVITLP